jgi:hypothetical protein
MSKGRSPPRSHPEPLYNLAEFFLYLFCASGCFAETDLGLAMAAANDHNLKLPSGSLTNTIYEKLKNDPEFGEKDFSVVYEWLDKANPKA